MRLITSINDAVMSVSQYSRLYYMEENDKLMDFNRLEKITTDTQEDKIFWSSTTKR